MIVTHMSTLSRATARPNISMSGDTQYTWVGRRSSKQKKKLLRWLDDRLCTSCYSSPTRPHTTASTPLDGKCKCGGDDDGRKEEESPTLLIIELGCGSSIHSIKIEADSLLAEHEERRARNLTSHKMALIRVNPNVKCSSERENCIRKFATEVCFTISCLPFPTEIGLGAEEALHLLYTEYTKLPLNKVERNESRCASSSGTVKRQKLGE